MREENEEMADKKKKQSNDKIYSYNIILDVYLK